jgi:hypothetical protein
MSCRNKSQIANKKMKHNFRQAPITAIPMCVSSEAVCEMRVGPSVGEVEQPPSAAADCMLRCSKEQGGERCNRCVCKSRTYREAAMRSR